MYTGSLIEELVILYMLVNYQELTVHVMKENGMNKLHSVAGLHELLHNAWQGY